MSHCHVSTAAKEGQTKQNWVYSSHRREGWPSLHPLDATKSYTLDLKDLKTSSTLGLNAHYMTLPCACINRLKSTWSLTCDQSRHGRACLSAQNSNRLEADTTVRCAQTRHFTLALTLTQKNTPTTAVTLLLLVSITVTDSWLLRFC